MMIVGRFCFNVAKNKCLLLKKHVGTHMEKCRNHKCIIWPNLQSKHTSLTSVQIKLWNITSIQKNLFNIPFWAHSSHSGNFYLQFQHNRLALPVLELYINQQISMWLTFLLVSMLEESFIPCCSSNLLWLIRM